MPQLLVEMFCSRRRGIQLRIRDRPCHLKENTSDEERSSFASLQESYLRKKKKPLKSNAPHKLDSEIPRFLCNEKHYKQSL